MLQWVAVLLKTIMNPEYTNIFLLLDSNLYILYFVSLFFNIVMEYYMMN